MPTLNWIGIEAVVNHHQQVPFHLLKDVPDLACGEPGEGNLIVQGDNLVNLKAVLPKLRRAGEVHLHRLAVQCRQREPGLQRQCEQPVNARMARQGCRQRGRDTRPARPLALHDVSEAHAAAAVSS